MHLVSDFLVSICNKENRVILKRNKIIDTEDFSTKKKREKVNMKLQMCVCRLSSKYLKSQEFIVYVQIQKY